MNERELNFSKATLALQADRYLDAVEYLKPIVLLNTELDDDEKCMLSAAFKQLVVKQRNSIEKLVAFELQAVTSRSNIQIGLSRLYRKKIEQELVGVCKECDLLLDNNLLPFATTDESRVFYRKLKGDFYRYSIEYVDDRVDVGQKAFAAYFEAYNIALQRLPSTHPDRLSVAINYSAFHVALNDDFESACELAEAAFDVAKNDCYMLHPDYRENTFRLLRVLEQNINEWKKLK